MAHRKSTARKQLLLDTLKTRRVGEDDRCDLQDAIAGDMSFEELTAFYAGLDQADRKTFIWVAFRVLDVDTAMEICRRVILQKRFEEMTAAANREIEVAWDRLHERERTWEESRKPIFKRIARMRREMEHLTWERDMAQANARMWAEEYHKQRDRALENEDKARKYDQLVELLGRMMCSTRCGAQR